MSPNRPELPPPQPRRRTPRLRFYRTPVKLLALSLPVLLLALVWLRACAPPAPGGAAGPAAERLARRPIPTPGPKAPPPETSPAPPPQRLQMPVHGVEPSQLRDNFAETRGRDRAHEAIDILAPRDTPVLAVADGTVAKLWQSVPGGITLYQFDESGRFCYYYAHLERYAGGIAEGARLRRGQVIGYVGTSGNAPRDTPHLHFAIYRLTPERRWWEGEPLNPFPLLAGATSSPSD